MKQTQMLFSTPMVLALLAKIKRITRRVSGLEVINQNPDDWEKVGDMYVNEKGKLVQDFITKDGQGMGPAICPYGKPGDVLWVRESWRIAGWDFENGEMLVEYKDGSKETCLYPDPNENDEWMIKQVDLLAKKGIIIDVHSEGQYLFTDKPNPWKPSIHMPKSACRLYLQITDIRAERLQDISEDDAIWEGIESWDFPTGGDDYQDYYKNYFIKTAEDRMYAMDFTCPVDSFKSLWQSINGPESWNVNPFVWVISFERIDKPKEVQNGMV